MNGFKRCTFETGAVAGPWPVIAISQPSVTPSILNPRAQFLIFTKGYNEIHSLCNSRKVFQPIDDVLDLGKENNCLFSQKIPFKLSLILFKSPPGIKVCEKKREKKKLFFCCSFDFHIHSPSSPSVYV